MTTAQQSEKYFEVILKVGLGPFQVAGMDVKAHGYERMEQTFISEGNKPEFWTVYTRLLQNKASIRCKRADGKQGFITLEDVHEIIPALNPEIITAIEAGTVSQDVCVKLLEFMFEMMHA